MSNATDSSKDPVMIEPFRAEFVELIRRGAGGQDIHDATEARGYARANAFPSQAFIDRELKRVAAHQTSLCAILDHFVGKADSILDVGCGTGGTTVALALSGRMAAKEVVGVDPNPVSLEAARVRALGHRLGPERLRFENVSAGEPLPFPDNRFDLTVSVSVLEFISSLEGRASFASELVRVTKPGGHVFISTPSPYQLREFHTKRWLGNWRRSDGFPWSCPPSAIRGMCHGCTVVPIDEWEIRRLVRARGFGGETAAAWLAPVLRKALTWQKLLFRKNAPAYV